MKIIFVKFFDRNPYQRLLADSLEKQGHEVVLLKSIYRFRFLFSLKADVVHLHWPPEFSWELSSMIKLAFFRIWLEVMRVKGTRIVWTVHNLLPHDNRFRRANLNLCRSYASRCDTLICHSALARKVVLRSYRVNPEKVTVTPHGNFIDVYPEGVGRVRFRENRGFSEQDVVVLFFGKIRAYKGLRKFIDSFARSSNTQIRFVVAGSISSESLADELKRFAEREQRLSLEVGYVADSDLRDYFEMADFVALPYESSLTSGAAVLAMSLGKACLATRTAGFESVLDDSGCIFYDSAEVDVLWKQVFECTTSRDMGRANLEKAKQWDWDSIGATTAKAYRRKALEML
ncbi:glycosyltransferase family 4 protein [Pelagicoccus albus]|uniref:Glycosyltransferase family 4 protein n=1 Tax=Pelagicoccus albus TaxID=415222 RepID=A0A7X1E7K1_9BACT|nr:glycosyltransferase family 4 protein [Pelagicoccus albus]MBC2605825.1 glycosyltransferase family 4 protein [Pelagicoccus albus]